MSTQDIHYSVNKMQSEEQVFVATPVPIPGEYPMQPITEQQPQQQPNQQSNTNVLNIRVFKLNSKRVLHLGISSIMFGFALLVCGICSVAIFGTFDYNEASGGIWCGVIIITAGSLSIVSSRNPSHKVLNAVNLGFHSFALCCCIAALVLFGLTIEFYSGCTEWFYVWTWRGYSTPIRLKNCPSDREGAVGTYSLMIIFAVVQAALSITTIVFCCVAYPSCRSCCAENAVPSKPGFQRFENSIRGQTYPQTFQTGFANVEQSVQNIPPGQILYMMTPVAVTTQYPQNASQANQAPQATLVMA